MFVRKCLVEIFRYREYDLLDEVREQRGHLKSFRCEGCRGSVGRRWSNIIRYGQWKGEGEELAKGSWDKSGESLDDIVHLDVIVQALVADHSLDEVHRRAGLATVCEERERRFKDAEKK